MEFDEIVVKESPGLCRCCLSEGCYKDLGSEYTWMNEAEVYADMLLECFDISITQHNEGPNGPSRLICEVCITRLRDACNFKKQVLDSEKKFIDMLGRGEFRPKVLIYQTQMKTENSDEQVQEEVEYLEDDLDFDDDEVLKPSVDEHSSSPLETVTSETISLKRKLKTKKTKISRPKKHVEVDEKPKSSKAVSKGMRKMEITEEIRSDQLLNIRHNVLLVLQYGTVVPFQWTTKGFRCFYCSKPMKDCEVVKEHTVKKHANIDLVDFIPKKIITKDVPVKVDVSNVSCKACDETLSNIDALIEHIQIIHEEIYDINVEKCFLPFLLNRDAFDCVLCECKYDNFTSMINHMHKSHVYHSVICQECGLSFINKARLMRHMKNSHKDHKCNICLKLFDAVHKLEKHKERIHGKAKSFQCDLCSECFESGYQFKVHMGKVHNVEKYRIKCELCPKVCTTKGAMLLHVQSVHSEMKFKCDRCEYETGIKWMITLHKRKHTGVRDYVCSVCDKQFRRSSNLRAHMKVHSGASGRVCRVCRKGFLDADTLSQHEMELHYYNKY